MSENPFAIKPGEKLSPQQLFERWLNWHNYSESHNLGRRHETCDKSLWCGNLCCAEHFEHQAEYDTFIRYFRHLLMILPGISGFSMNSMVMMIRACNLEIDDNTRALLAIYWGIFADMFFKALDSYR